MVGELLVCSKSLNPCQSLLTTKIMALLYILWICNLFILGMTLVYSVSKYFHNERVWQKIRPFLSPIMSLMLTGMHDEIGSLQLCPFVLKLFYQTPMTCHLCCLWNFFCQLDLSTIMLWHAFHVCRQGVCKCLIKSNDVFVSKLFYQASMTCRSCSSAHILLRPPISWLGWVCQSICKYLYTAVHQSVVTQRSFPAPESLTVVFDWCRAPGGETAMFTMKSKYWSMGRPCLMGLWYR